MDDQRKDYIYPKGPKQRGRSKQLQTNNLPTDDVEVLTAQIREGIYNLLTSRGSFLEKEKGCGKDPEAQQSYFT